MSSSTAAAPARSSPPSADKSVTELAAGSGLVGPTLFDAYRKFHPQPALQYALPVVRRPGPGMATLFSGGYVASGTGTPDRLPSPFRPAGLRLTKIEGAGEVQTPVLGAAADGLRIGDRVWMRHAKGGELAERLTHYHLVESSDGIAEERPDLPGRRTAALDNATATDTAVSTPPRGTITS